MRYKETAGQSAEVMRMVLPRIAQHGAHYAPTAYSVWYEHLAGLNPALSQAVQAALAGSDVLEITALDKLFAQFVIGRDAEAMEQLQQDLGQLLHSLAGVANSCGDGAARHAESLAEAERELASVQDAGHLARIVHSLVATTAEARRFSQQLQAEVEQNRATVQQLRDHLGALQNEALTDPLTGLLNRRGLEREFTRRFEQAPADFERCGVLIADIDQFKRINDSYGHVFGDQVIRAAAQALSQAVKGRDLIARWGGEEFLLLLPETPRAGALTLAEQVRMAFAKVRIRRAGSEEFLEKLTISIGVAMPLAGETLERTIVRADAALYKAKYAGRNRVCMAEIEPLGAGRQNATR